MTRIIEEAGLDPGLRAKSGALLAGEWGEDWSGDGYAGEFAPQFRVVEMSSGRLAGHVSAFVILAEPALRLYGIGDLVVRAERRGRGIAARICAAVVDECVRRGGEVILVDTVAAERTFRALGFERVREFSFFYERDGACHRHPYWLVRASVALPERVELLEHGDF